MRFVMADLEPQADVEEVPAEGTEDVAETEVSAEGETEAPEGEEPEAEEA